MKKKEAAALAKQAEEEAAQMATAETDDVKAQMAADFAKNNAALKKKNADGSDQDDADAQAMADEEALAAMSGG